MAHKHKGKRGRGRGATTVWKSAKESAKTLMKELNDKWSKDPHDDFEADGWVKSPSGTWTRIAGKGGNGYDTGRFQSYGSFCTHKGAHFIGLAGANCEVWAGAANEGYGTDWALVISLSDSAMNDPVVKVTPDAEALLGGFFKTSYRRASVQFDWPDATAPWSVTAHDWINLAKGLSQMTGKVYIHCLGGHGRTGTALAILAHYLGWLPTDDSDPVAWLRLHYCREVVETEGQINYVERMTGRKVTAKHSHDWGKISRPAAQAASTVTTPAQASLPLASKPNTVTAGVAEGTIAMGPSATANLAGDAWTFVRDGEYKVYRGNDTLLVKTNEAGDVISTEKIYPATASTTKD